MGNERKVAELTKCVYIGKRVAAFCAHCGCQLELMSGVPLQDSIAEQAWVRVEHDCTFLNITEKEPPHER